MTMVRLARFNEFGELRVCEKVSGLPEGFEKIDRSAVDQAVITLFPDAKEYYYNQFDDRYCVEQSDGTIFEERNLTFSGSLFITSSYSIGQDLPKAYIEVAWNPKLPTAFLHYREIPYTEVPATRSRRFLAVLQAGPGSKMPTFVRTPSALFAAWVSIQNGYLIAIEKFVKEQSKGIRKLDLAKILGVSPSRITDVSKRIGIPTRRVGPRQSLDWESVQRIISTIGNIDEAKMKEIDKLYRQAESAK